MINRSFIQYIINTAKYSYDFQPLSFGQGKNADNYMNGIDEAAHVKKLKKELTAAEKESPFWCFFGGTIGVDGVTYQVFPNGRRDG